MRLRAPRWPTRAQDRPPGSSPTIERRTFATQPGAADFIALQSTAGNAAVSQLVRSRHEVGLQRQVPTTTEAPDGTASQGDLGHVGPQTGAQLQELDIIEQRYRDMIVAARARGADTAADHLEHFLAGSGATRQVPVDWLRSYGVVTGAETANEGRFEDSLNDLANDMVDGERRTFEGFRGRMLTAWPFTELFFASGTSTVKSTGKFELRRVGDFVSISGDVEHRWTDVWDWHQGKSASVPGFGNVSDTDGLLMQQHRGARPFAMESIWKRHLAGGIDRGLLLNDRYLSWSGPR